MTKRDFEALADALANVRPSHSALDTVYRGWKDSVFAVADVCAASNPRFDRERFIAACESR